MKCLKMVAAKYGWSRVTRGAHTEPVEGDFSSATLKQGM